jgi:hypothetical protein
MAVNLLTPTIPYVRDWSTLSATSRKEGEKNTKKLLNPLSGLPERGWSSEAKTG